jgi:hypothetical protein
MNRAQQQLVWSGAVVMALLGIAAAKELNKPGLHCKQDVIAWVDGRGRWVQAKAQDCD